MKLDDLLLISFRQVLRQRRRNMGVVIAIALGTASFIAVITMSQDVKNNLNKDLELLGGVTKIKATFEKIIHQDSGASIQWFRPQTVASIRQIPKVNSASLLIPRLGMAKSTIRGKVYQVRMVGVDDQFWRVNSFKPIYGVFFGPDSIQNRERVCVIGKRLAKTVFGREDAVGMLLPLDQDIYKVIGVLGGLGITDKTDWAFIPISTAQDRITGNNLPRIVYVRAETWDDVEYVAKQISLTVAAHQSSDGLNVIVFRDRLKQVKRVSWWVQLFIYLSVAATLILGGFGIWNIMMVSVQARTREIGLKKAIGAMDKDIMAQFLAEALCLSLIAALIGIVLGRIGIEVMCYLLDSKPNESLFFLCLLLGILFSVIIGVGAGLYPSIRASRMEVVSAVRYE